MNTQEFDKVEISREKLSNVSDIGYSPISIRKVIDFFIALLNPKVSKSKNCSTSLIIERDDLSMDDVYIKIRFCVNRPRDEVYAFCRNVKHFPLFITPLIEVGEENETHSFWKIKLPGSGQIVGLNMVITKGIKNEMLRWTTEESELMTEGNILFLDAPKPGTTELKLFFSFKCIFILKNKNSLLSKSVFRRMIKKDIENFQKLLEIYNHEDEIPSNWI